MEDNLPGELALEAYQQRYGDDSEVEVEVEVAGLSDEGHAAVDRITAQRIRTDAAEADFLARSRTSNRGHANLYTFAKGETPDDFVEPNTLAPAYSAPKAASGFAVVSAKRRRPAAAPP